MRSKLGIQESTRKKLPEKLREVSCWLHAQFSGAKGTQVLVLQHRDTDYINITDCVMKDDFC